MTKKLEAGRVPLKGTPVIKKPLTTELASLKVSLKRLGQVQPVQLKSTPKGGYIVVDGRKRVAMLHQLFKESPNTQPYVQCINERGTTLNIPVTEFVSDENKIFVTPSASVRKPAKRVSKPAKRVAKKSVRKRRTNKGVANKRKG